VRPALQELAFPKVSVSKETLDWLLEDEPSVQYFTLTGLMDHGENDRSVRDTRGRIGREGWAATILAKQKDGIYWENPESCYVPKWSSCAWQLAVLADIGLVGSDERIENSVEHYLHAHNVETGGFALRPRGSEGIKPHVCSTGNMIRSLAKFGYGQDERVVKAMDWLISEQLVDGGWNCFTEDGAKHGSFQATIEPLWALAAMLQIHPLVKRWEDAAAKGSEFLLRHRIYKSKRNDSPVLLEFLTIHYPMHYRYDFLHGLRVLSELGAKYDPRMADAVNLLRQKRLPDGKWVLEGVYRGWRQSVGIHGGKAVSRPEEREAFTEGWGDGHTLQLEEAGKPSKWITLQALLTLKRLGILEGLS